MGLVMTNSFCNRSLEISDYLKEIISQGLIDGRIGSLPFEIKCRTISELTFHTTLKPSSIIHGPQKKGKGGKVKKW